jgi:hypothetical protein
MHINAVAVDAMLRADSHHDPQYQVRGDGTREHIQHSDNEHDDHPHPCGLLYVCLGSCMSSFLGSR